MMPSEDTKILEFHQYQKSDKASFCHLCRLMNVKIIQIHLQQK